MTITQQMMSGPKIGLQCMGYLDTTYLTPDTIRLAVQVLAGLPQAELRQKQIPQIPNIWQHDVGPRSNQLLRGAAAGEHPHHEPRPRPLSHFRVARRVPDDHALARRDPAGETTQLPQGRGTRLAFVRVYLVAADGEVDKMVHVPSAHACVRGIPIVGGAYRYQYTKSSDMLEQSRHVVDQGRILRVDAAEATMPSQDLVSIDAVEAGIAQARRGYADYFVPCSGGKRRGWHKVVRGGIPSDGRVEIGNDSIGVGGGYAVGVVASAPNGLRHLGAPRAQRRHAVAERAFLY